MGVHRLERVDRGCGSILKASLGGCQVFVKKRERVMGAGFRAVFRYEALRRGPRGRARAVIT
jgi:hypothetical protein